MVKSMGLVLFGKNHVIDRLSTCIKLSSAYVKPSKKGISYGVMGKHWVKKLHLVRVQ
jgi:hypothetical protein